MRELRSAATIVAAMVTAAVVAAGCSDSTNPGDGNGGGGSNTVTVKNDFYQPATLTVPVGATVTWNWSSGGALHSVTFDTGSVSSPTQGSGSFAHTFAAAGTVHYHCAVHGQAMSGTIVVSPSASNGSSGDTTSGTGTGTGTGDTTSSNPYGY